MAPLSPIAIVRVENNERHFALVRWGLVPSWVKEIRPGKPVINARAETLLEKPSFRNALRRRRCLIPADGSELETAASNSLLKKQPVVVAEISELKWLRVNLVAEIFLVILRWGVDFFALKEKLSPLS